MDKKNFLIFGLNYIGDVLMLTPAIRALKTKFPESRIFAVVSAEAAPVLHRNPNVYKVIERKKPKGVSEFFYLYQELKQYNFYACLNFLTSFKFGLLTLFLSKKRIGLAGSKAGFFFNYKIHDDKLLHNIDRAMQFTDIFFLKEKFRSRELIYNVTDGDLLIAKTLLKNSGLNYNENEDVEIVLFAPGSTRSSKRANPKLFSSFADYLNRLNIYVLLTGSKDDKLICKGIYELTENKNRTFDISGISDLYALGGLIKLSKLVVAVDNGTMHLASAVGTPVIGLFGSTDPSICGPVSKKSYIIDKNSECRHCFLNKCSNPKWSFLKKDYPGCMDLIVLGDLVNGMNTLL